MYTNNDWRDYSLSHSWGTTPRQKQREKEYNAWYWDKFKERIKAQRRRSQGRLDAVRNPKQAIKGNKVERTNALLRKSPKTTTKDSSNDSGNRPMTRAEQIMYNYKHGISSIKKREIPNDEGGGGGGGLSEKELKALEKARKKAEKEKEKQRKAAEKAALKAQKDAERQRKAEESARVKAQKEAERQAKAEENARTKAAREVESARKKEERERAAEARAKEKEAKENDKKKKEEVRETNANAFNDLVKKFEKTKAESDGANPLNNFKSFKKELSKTKYNTDGLSDDDLISLWKSFKSKVNNNKKTNPNKEGYVDSEVKSSMIFKYKNKVESADEKSPINNYAAYKSELRKKGYEGDEDDIKEAWEEFRKKLGVSKKSSKTSSSSKKTTTKTQETKKKSVDGGRLLSHGEINVMMGYPENDWRTYLAHGWGHKPEQKKREKEYNAEYYRNNKEKWGVGKKNKLRSKLKNAKKVNKNDGESIKDKIKDFVGYDERERRDSAESDLVAARRAESNAQKKYEYEYDRAKKAQRDFDRENPATKDGYPASWDKENRPEWMKENERIVNERYWDTDRASKNTLKKEGAYADASREFNRTLLGKKELTEKAIDEAAERAKKALRALQGN